MSSKVYDRVLTLLGLVLPPEFYLGRIEERDNRRARTIALVVDFIRVHPRKSRHHERGET
jgi:hypothetical protein